MPRWPVERIEGDAAVDPARRVARVEGVRERRQEIFVDAGGVAHQRQHLAADMLGKLLGREAADQRLGEIARGEPLEIAADLVDKAEADLIGRHLIVEDPFFRFGDRDGLGEQIVHLDDLDAAVAHLGHEVEMIALGVVDPQHVVEQAGRRNCSGVSRWWARPGAQTMTLRS